MLSDNVFQYHRTDLLTGCGTLLSFLEWLERQETFGPAALISIDINHFKDFNDRYGHERGDALLRWAALEMVEAMEGPVFRLGDDEFVVAVEGDDYQQHQASGELLFAQLNQEGERVNLPSPAVSVAVIFYPAGFETSPAQALGFQESAMTKVKTQGQRTVMAFHAAALSMPLDSTGLLNKLVERIISMGASLDEAGHLAFTDPLTTLPNLRAALRRLEAPDSDGLAILLVDGDNLKTYNDLGGYAAGDKMLCDLAETLQSQLRPGDFLARWRTGDEFLALLRGCDLSSAMAVAERLRRSVVEPSSHWIRPVTVTIGVAAGRIHGDTPGQRLAAAELALLEAKQAGKNRVQEAKPE
jgi:diguanylate cyclase (GGDEF)-like protein